MTANEFPDYKCPYDECDFLAYKLAQIDNHVNKVHKQVKPWECGMEGCAFAALDKSMLNAHIRNVHQNIRNYPCDQCEHRSKSKKARTDHINAVHLKVCVARKIKCSFNLNTSYFS